MLKEIHPVIKQPLYLFVVVAIVSMSAVFISGSYLDDAYDREMSEKRAMRIWKNKIDGSRESNKIIDQYESSYTSLVKRHVIGEENRLSWYETIQATTNKRGMPSVKYNITSQKLMEDLTGQHRAKGLNVFRSKMTLDIKMAHEGDLFVMLNNLENKAKGLFSVDKCEIEKQQSRSEDIKQNMQSFCELSWYTFKSSENAGAI